MCPATNRPIALRWRHRSKLLLDDDTCKHCQDNAQECLCLKRQLMESQSFVVPLTLPNVSELGRNCTTRVPRDLCQISFALAQPSVLVSWGLAVELSNRPEEDLVSQGAAVGCKDGTIFVFHGKLATGLNEPVCGQSDSSLEDKTRVSQAIGQLPHHSDPAEKLSSPASATFNAPFNITTRSRIVSGISAEQVEAPKNYVDFDEEADKLKDMLKGRTIKDTGKSVDTSDHPAREKGTSPNPASLKSASDMARKDNPKSLLSATNSPAFTPRSVSRTTSPTPVSAASAYSHPFALQCHIVPRSSGDGRSVVGMCLLVRNSFLAVLQETGDVSIFRTIDGMCVASSCAQMPPLQPPAGIQDCEPLHDVWIWNRLLSVTVNESAIIIAFATVDTASANSNLDASNTSAQENTRVVVFEFSSNDVEESRLEKVAEWYTDGLPGGFDLHCPPDSSELALLHLSSEGQLIEQQLKILPRTVTQPPVALAVGADLHHLHHNLHHLPHLSLPFRPSKPPPSVPVRQQHESGRVALTKAVSLAELLAHPQGLRICRTDGRLRGIAWSDQELVVFDYEQQFLRKVFVVPTLGMRDVSWIDGLAYAIAFADRIEFHEIRLSGAEMPVMKDDTSSCKFRLTQVIHCGPYEALHLRSLADTSLVQMDEQGHRQLMAYSPETTRGRGAKGKTMWSVPPKADDTAPPTQRLTAMLPLELDLVILGYSDGHIRRSSINQMVLATSCPPVFDRVSDLPLNGCVMGLHIVHNHRTSRKFVLGGADDGAIALWELDSLKLCARWTVFTSPLMGVMRFENEPGSLRDCFLCCSHDGTIAVIAVDGLQFLYLIPGSRAPLERVCVGGDNIMLTYSDQRTRLWDVKTREFWRSMGTEKAKELLQQGGWEEATPDGGSCLPDCALMPLLYTQALDVVSTVVLDVCKVISNAASVKLFGNGIERKETVPSLIKQFRSVLSVLLTPGLSEDIDHLCQQQLDIGSTAASIGLSFHGCASLFCGNEPQDAWCISSEVSASRALGIVVLLRALAALEDSSDGYNPIIAFYATSLPHFIGPSYQPPSLPYLARCWFSLSNELRQASRILIDARIARMSDEEANTLANRWQHFLPCLQPDAERESMGAALALFICGHIAAEKFSLFSPNTLTDISKSMALYLHNEHSSHQVLAIDVCSRGFQIWQHYVDAMEILRALSLLATNTRKDSISSQNAGPQARLAILQIASSNTALFMTTLALDILNPHSMDHRKSVMQIVAFLIRKRPLVLYPNLPRLMEAVVKSLDPNSNNNREAVLDTATEIIGQVVKTFPSIDFHTPSQRLAVGTSEGAIVMYDLKTATRLYVLENHKTRPAACSFSPDGRRLVTVSLQESVVLVWKVGSSFTSFFNPGAPPRQGHAGSEPFKTLSFNAGDPVDTSVQATLDNVRFEWTGDRSVKLKIFQIVLSFTT